MNGTEQQNNQAPNHRPDPLFSVYDVVSLEEPWPEAGLEVGAWGTVLAVEVDGTYRIEFTDREGAPLLEAFVPEASLGLVWADPDAEPAE